MNVVVAERGATERELDLEIPGENLESLVETKIETYRKKINLPGFRPGKLPKDVVKKRFGASIRAEAIEDLVDKSIREALTEKKILPVAPGQVEKLDAPEAGPIKVKYLFEVDPEIELKDYKGLGVKLDKTEIKDADVDARIEEIRNQTAQIVRPERASQTGDLITARYQKILVEGVEMPAPVPVFQAELGKGIPAVDAALTGASVGQELAIDFTFPADYQDASQAGKAARYEVVVEGVFERKLSDVTDEWASQLGPFKTLADLRDRVRKDLEQHAENTAKQKAHDEAMDIVLSRNPFAVPKARVEHFVNWQRDRMIRQGAQVPELPELMQVFGAEAEKQLRRQRAIEWIAEKEQIKATTEEVDARIKEMAEQAGISAEDAREELRKSGRLMEVRESIRMEKTADWLVSA
ncbi:MAG TPA: trigger factor [Fibrobacteria bacterium]|nr:trigger factor [Fibrobacteria bacterium]